jgi:micrococcal nuclease
VGADGLTRPLALLALLAGLLAGCSAEELAQPAADGAGRVARVADGDTLRLVDGRRVRLVQIDAPEAGAECYGDDARNVLQRLAPAGARVALERDPRLDDRDRFGRLLRYVRAGSTDLNLELVRRGAAAPYFFRGEHGRHADALLRAAESAREARRGLWGACPSARLNPERALDSGRG